MDITRVRTFLKNGFKIGQILLCIMAILLCTTLLVYPTFASGDMDTDQPGPEDCVSTPNQTVSSDESATVTGTMERDDDDPGIVTISYHSTDGSNSLGIDVSEDIDVIDTEGFEDVGSSVIDYRWDSNEDEHSITYQFDIDVYEEIMAEEGIDRERNYHPATNDSTIVPLLDHTSEDVSLETSGEGHIASDTAFLGDFSTENRSVGCQDFELVIDDDASPLFDPESRLDDLEAAARAIDSSEQSETVTVFVTGEELGDLGGYASIGGNTIVVEDYRHDRNPTTLWIHEYVHTLQGSELGDDMRWANEGTADYLSYKVALDEGLISPAEYDSYLAGGNQDFGGQTLNESTTHEIAYQRGSAVFAQLDSDLEDSDISIYDVFEWLYSDGQTDYSDFENYLETEANLSESTTDRYDGYINSDTQIPEQYMSSFTSVSPIDNPAHHAGLFTPSMRVFLIGALIYSIAALETNVIGYLRLDSDFEF